MSIRCAAKALVISEGRVLLNRCQDPEGHVYYDLPGGGQQPYETMEDAVKREVLEETGYPIAIDRFAALAEEIYEDDALRKQFPDYTHRIYHVFLAHLLDSPRRDPTETDRNQRASEWHTLEEASSLPVLYPRGIGTLLSGVPEVPVYLGSCFIE